MMASRLRFIRPWALLCFVWLALPATARPSAPPDSGWVSLFNGKDLAGWETWLARMPGETRMLGLNNDPLKVFSVEDGSLRISGQVFGALTTTEEYENYHLRLEQRWGEQKWPPRLERPKDSGICYHATGAHGLFAGSWMKSYQLQVGEGSTGDHWNIAGPVADAETEPYEAERRYKRGGEPTTIGKGHIAAAERMERPSGEWNTIELIARGDSSTYIVNGKTVMVLSRLRDGAEGSPLTQGRIQLQSEGAEVWYRNIRIRPLPD